MKKLIFLSFALVLAALESQAQQQQFKVITVVESIVPMGLGRSRLIETKTEADVSALTTERTEGTDTKQGSVKRKDIKADAFSEAKLLNFFSMTGINFQNIASNDAVIAAKINELSADGWKLTFVTSGVESNAGQQDGEGIFVTRMFFARDVVK